MSFVCSELQGATHQPKELLELDGCWVIPASKEGPVLTTPDSRLVFVCDEATDKDKAASVEYYFVLCYQFLFCSYSHVYWYYSLRQLNPSQSFVLNGADIGDIEREIRNRLVRRDTEFASGIASVAAEMSRDFSNLAGPYGTLLPCSVNFTEFYVEFTKLYKQDNGFKELVTLFCETINGLRPLYDNVLQQITQLQTICDTMLDGPQSSKCPTCQQDRYVEDWDAFLDKRLRELGIEEPEDISLITRIRKKLNKVARVKYVHHSSYRNPWDIRTLGQNIRAGESSYAFDVNEVLKREAESWRPLDWANLYAVYLVFVRNLIFVKYLCHETR